MIITFDSYGVSGHCNHRDVHYGVCKLLHDTLPRDVEVWELVSTNILRKYSGPVDIWLSMFWAMLHSDGTMQCLVNEHSRRSFKAMAQHSSQWVWFRKLFVALSSYTYMNTLRKVKWSFNAEVVVLLVRSAFICCDPALYPSTFFRVQAINYWTIFCLSSSLSLLHDMIEQNHC